jgi:hypothetical protein
MARDVRRGAPVLVMRRAIPLAFLFGIVGASSSGAHPMGNTSISHYAGIEALRDSVRVKYLLDFAEIPSFRELELVDPNRDDHVTPEEREAYLSLKTDEIVPRLRLTVNGRPAALRSRWNRVTFPAGEGGLSTVRPSGTFSCMSDRSRSSLACYCSGVWLIGWAKQNSPDLAWRYSRSASSACHWPEVYGLLRSPLL